MEAVFNEKAGATLAEFIKQPPALLLQALPNLKSIVEAALAIGNLAQVRTPLPAICRRSEAKVS
jgi:hypothetical protein